MSKDPFDSLRSDPNRHARGRQFETVRYTDFGGVVNDCGRPPRARHAARARRRASFAQHAGAALARALDELLAELTRERSCERLSLRPFSAAETGALASAMAAATVPQVLVAA